ncbi:MAG: hypothetical protein U9N81_15160 [Bacillota bacterium]|nr:hypothetical protein [Bacillota bacterium]
MAKLKGLIIGVLAGFIIGILPAPVLAYVFYPPTTDQSEVQRIINKGAMDRLEPCTQPDETGFKEFVGATYWTKSTKASKNSSIKYRTTQLKIRIGPADHPNSLYTAFDASDFSMQDKMDYGQVYYSMVGITMGDFYNRMTKADGTRASKKEVDLAFEQFDMIYVGATVAIYSTDINHPLQTINTLSEVDAACAATGFGAYADEMKTRWNAQLIIRDRPDFSPVPSGATSWQEKYLTEPAFVVDGSIGSTKDVQFDIINTGIFSDITDVLIWREGNFEEEIYYEKEIKVEAGDRNTITIPDVKLDESFLAIKVNVDGVTPSHEAQTAQFNNMMLIQLGGSSGSNNAAVSGGVDLAITGKLSRSSVSIPPNGTPMSGSITYTITRKDSGTDLVTGVVTMYGPVGTKTATVTLTGGQSIKQAYLFKTGVPGTYQMSAQVWPSGQNELNPTDNCTPPYIMTFTKQAYPERKDGDSGIEGGLGG